ncbi:MAG: ABC transporter permease subunit [Streptosporangiales bacterium]|nr:ABC transporter permease subunit [Streptosporangiales bacterium]
MVAVIVTTILGMLVNVIPGDPATLVMGPRASPELARQVRAEMGLDQPVLVQVVMFLWNAVRGDLGTDFVNHQPVAAILAAYLPHTIILAVVALGLAALVGIPMGVYAATKPGTVVDTVTSLVSVSFITMPSYVVALLLLLVFPVLLGVLPATGVGDITVPADYIRHLVLPAVALALVWVGYLARVVRSGMLEVLGANYIRAARALGLGERLIAYRYALKNAIVPTVALLGVGLGDLLGGAVFVEVIFARPGLGSLIVEAIEDRNYPIVRGAVLVIALLFVLANLAADLSYRVLDPRIRVEESGRLA